MEHREWSDPERLWAVVPVAGKPILGHILDRLVDLGIRRTVLVIGYILGDRWDEAWVIQKPSLPYCVLCRDRVKEVVDTEERGKTR